MLMNQCFEPAVTEHPTLLVKGFTNAVGGEDDNLTGPQVLLTNFKIRLSENAQRQPFTAAGKNRFQMPLCQTLKTPSSLFWNPGRFDSVVISQPVLTCQFDSTCIMIKLFCYSVLKSTLGPPDAG